VTATYDKIAAHTIPTATSSYTFTSIPSTYTDLVLIFNGTSSISTTGTLQFNSDTATNYSNTYVFGNGTSVASGRSDNQTATYQFYPSTTISTAIINIMNYSNTTTNKTVITRVANTSSYALANVGLWRSTSAITSIAVLTTGGTFSVGSTFTLYGIKAE
jgi:hypothetical protein